MWWEGMLGSGPEEGDVLRASARGHLLSARAVDLPQQSQEQRLLAGSRRSIEQRVREVPRLHLQEIGLR